MESKLTAFQRAKIKFGVSHPAEQLLLLEERVSKLEKLVLEMVRPESPAERAENIEAILEEPVTKVELPKRRGGRPKGSKNK